MVVSYLICRFVVAALTSSNVKVTKTKQLLIVYITGSYYVRVVVALLA